MIPVKYPSFYTSANPVHTEKQTIHTEQTMHTILVVGSGFAGMWTALSATRLIDQTKPANIQVIVVSPEPTCVIRPRLYEPDADDMHVCLQDLFHATDIQYIRGRVETINPDQKQVTIQHADTQTSQAYDRLVLAAGSQLKRPDIPGLQEHAYSIDQRHDAAILETHLRSLAAQPSSPARNTVVVAGGGFTGIEIAAELPSRLRSLLGPDEDIRVVVVEQAPEIGPELGPGPRPVILEALTALGVVCKSGAALTSVDETGVVTSRDAERIDAWTTIWTGGMQASTLTRHIPGERDRLGRLRVDSDLRVVSPSPPVRDIFVAGDAAWASTDDLGNHALMSCQHAIPLGRFAGHNAAASLLGLASKPYAQPAYVTCLDLGPWGAVVTRGWDRQVSMKGSEAKRVKRNINQVVIYPPRADRAEAFWAADPDTPGPRLD